MRASPWRSLATAALALTMALSLSGCDPRQWFVCALGACGGPALDYYPPTAPVGLTATPADRQVVLNWADNTELDVGKYVVYRATTPGGPYQEVARPLTSAWTDPMELGAGHDLVNGTTYYYVVSAIDRAGGESVKSDEVSATPAAVVLPARPAAPTLQAQGDFLGEVHLSWTAVAGAVEYHLSRSTTPGGPHAPVESTSELRHTDDLLTGGTTYYYVVTAEDAFGQLSDNSNEASAAPFHTPGPDLSFVREWGAPGTGDGEFTSPTGIAAGPGGFVYVTDNPAAGRVQKFTQDGTFVTGWTVDASAQGIAADAEDNVYVTDYFGQRVRKFTSTGSPVLDWGTGGSGDGEFFGPGGVATDADGNVYVVDTGNSRIQKFTSDGDFVTKWGVAGSTGFGEFTAPEGVTTDAEGNVYVADTGNHLIQKFDSDGGFLGQWGGQGADNGEFDSPRGVVVDNADRVAVADTINDRFQVFSTAGFLHAIHGSSGSGRAQFNGPNAVTSDCNASLYVLDAGNGRVQKYGDGSPPCDGPRLGLLGAGLHVAAEPFPRPAVSAAQGGRRFSASFATSASRAGRVAQRGAKLTERGARARGTFRGGLAQGRRARIFSRGVWHSIFDIVVTPRRRTGRATGHALATFRNRNAGRLCLRFGVRFAVTGRAKVTIRGSFRTRGGTRAASRLSARGSYSQRLRPGARFTIAGTARPARRGRAGLPRPCRRIQRAFRLR